jgi:hypothetical protein
MKPLTPRDLAHKKLEELREAGFSDTKILEDILGNQLSGSQALEVISEITNDFFGYMEEDDDNDDLVHLIRY